jgi:hypothetical protein
MGRWFEWHVDGGLTSAEFGRLKTVIEREIRPALPRIAEAIRADHANRGSVFTRIAMRFVDANTQKYANDPRTIRFEAGTIHIKATDRLDEFTFGFAAGDYAGHSIGFQDYLTIAVLAAASQVCGKVSFMHGDDIERDYVEHVLRRFADAGVCIKPSDDFAYRLDAHQEAYIPGGMAP